MQELSAKILRLIMMVFLIAAEKNFAQVKEMHIDSLSIDLATKIALENNPSIKIAYSNVDYSNASLRLSRSNYFPLLGIIGSASRTEGAFVFNPSFPPRDRNTTTILRDFSCSS